MTKKAKRTSPYALTRRQNQLGIGLLIAWLFYYNLLRPDIIGHDRRYDIYVQWLPLGVGMVALGIYRRQFLRHAFSEREGIVFNIIRTLFYLTEGLMVSFLSFGLVASLIWSYLNVRAAADNPTVTEQCPIYRIQARGKTPGIYYIYRGQTEFIKTSRGHLSGDIADHPEHYVLIIGVKNGIWGHALLKSWRIAPKR